MFGGKHKPLAELSRGEIIASTVAFIVIGTLIVSICVAKLLFSPTTFNLAWHGSGAAFVIVVVCYALSQVRGELKRRGNGR